MKSLCVIIRCIEKTTWFLALWSVYVKVSLNPYKNCCCRCIHASLCSFTSSASAESSVNPEPDGTHACPVTRRSATLLCWTCPKETVGHTAVIYHNSRVCVEEGGGGVVCVCPWLHIQGCLLFYSLFILVILCVCVPLMGVVSMEQVERKLVDVIRSMYFLPWSSKMMKGNELLEPFFLFFKSLLCGYSQ